MPVFINGNLFCWVYQDGTSQDTKFETFGPRADRLLVKFYSSSDTAWDALINNETDIADPTLTPTRYDQFNTSLSGQISVNRDLRSATLYLIDINNNNNPYLGNPPDPSYLNPVYPNPCSVLGLRKAIAYLCNRTQIVENVIRDTCFGSPAYTVVPLGNPYVHPDINPSGSRADLCYPYSQVQANASLDASGFSTYDAQGWRIWNATGQRVVLRFFIRNDASQSGQARYYAGNYIADRLEACGVKVQRIYGGASERDQIVLEQKNFHLYTGGWIGLETLDFLKVWNIESYAHPGRCDNYDGCNNTDYNEASHNSAYAVTEEQSIAAGMTAQEVFAENVLSVPLWSDVEFTAMNRRYVGSPGVSDGEDSYEGQYWEGVSPLEYNPYITTDPYCMDSFGYLNMHPQGYPIGDGQSMTIRYGFGSTSVGSLNPIYATDSVGNRILDFVGYEGLLKHDPYNFSRLIPWIAKSYTVGSYMNKDHQQCTNVSFSLRTDVLWSDGEPLTVDDVRFTFVELPRILENRGLNPPSWDPMIASIKDFRIIDPYNFEIAMNTTNYWNVVNAALCRIMPEHIWGQICESGDPTTFKPDSGMVATGPWRIAEYVPGDHMLLTPNPKFFKKNPIDCIVSIQNAQAGSNRIVPGTNVEYYTKIRNQCYDTAANISVQIYVDSLLQSSQILSNAYSDVTLGPFYTGSLQKGLHEIRIVCTPIDPSWMSPLVSQYTMPLYVTYREDLNLDYYVNVQDAVIVGNAFATYVGDSRWDPRADIYADYKVNALDVVTVNKRACETEWQAPMPHYGPTILVVSPNFTTFKTGDTFNVTVSLLNAIDVAGYQFTLSYDTGPLDLITVSPNWLFPVSGYSNASDNYSPTEGRCFVSSNLLFPELPFTGDSMLVNLTFRANYDGFSYFNFLNTLLIDSMVWQIPHEIRDYGHQLLPTVHDLGVKSIQPSQNAVYIGEVVSVDVRVQNLGDVNETANMTLYADLNMPIGDEVVIGKVAVAIRRYSSITVTLEWDTFALTAGNYNLSAVIESLPEEINLWDNNKTEGVVTLFQSIPCPDVVVTCPVNLTVNPSIFNFTPLYQARVINIGNVSIKSTGFEGNLRVLGSRNGTIRLCVNQLDVNVHDFYLPLYGEVDVPLWLMFQPETHWGTYSGNYTLHLTVCGTHRKQLTIVGIDIEVCQNGAYIVNDETVTFTWNLTGGSLVYLKAETNLPAGWSYTVDPPIGTFFETPHVVTVNITAPPDAREGDIGSVTLTAIKNETGMMIWQFVYFASTDNKPPEVESIETPIFTPDGSLIFNTTVKDASGIDEVMLHYSINGDPWQNRTMQWAAGDTFNSTQYALEEFVGTESKTVQYYLSVIDWFGNQTTTDTQTISVMNDLALNELSIGKPIVCEGYNTTLNVTVSNLGTLPLSFFNVAVEANSTIVATKPIFNLQNGTSVTLGFSLNLSKGTYSLIAFASPLPDESITANNALFGTVTVTMLADVNADGKVDVKDVYKVAKAYGSAEPPDPSPPDHPWNPACDINDDKKVDVKDYYIACRHYGEVDP